MGDCYGPLACFSRAGRVMPPMGLMGRMGLMPLMDRGVVKGCGGTSPCCPVSAAGLGSASRPASRIRMPASVRSVAMPR